MLHALSHCKLTLFRFSGFLLAVAQNLTHWECDAIQTQVHLKKTQLQLYTNSPLLLFTQMMMISFELWNIV